MDQSMENPSRETDELDRAQDGHDVEESKREFKAQQKAVALFDATRSIPRQLLPSLTCMPRLLSTYFRDMRIWWAYFVYYM
jgi:hypothetical protein